MRTALRAVRAALAALAVALAGAAPAQSLHSVDATGQAPVSGDAAAAAAAARDDALRGCVRDTVASVATAAADPDQAQLVQERILSRAATYVRRFQLLEERQDGSAAFARVRCELADAKLEDDLLAAGVVHRRAGLPRVLVLVAEQGLDAPRPAGWWEGAGAAGAALLDRLGRAGFSTVAPAALGEEARRALAADPALASAREVAARAGAEVVVVGRAVARPGPASAEPAALQAAVATVTARAIRTDTGAVVASVELAGVPGRAFDRASAERDALANAGRQLGRELFTRLATRWARERPAEHRVALGVAGVADYARVAALEAALSGEVRGVKGVALRSMGDGRADLDVTLAGTTESFATELATRRFDGFAVKVRSVGPDALDVELLEPPRAAAAGERR